MSSPVMTAPANNELILTRVQASKGQFVLTGHSARVKREQESMNTELQNLGHGAVSGVKGAGWTVKTQREEKVQFSWHEYTCEVICQTSVLISKKKNFLILLGDRTTKGFVWKTKTRAVLENTLGRTDDGGEGVKLRKPDSPSLVPHTSISYRNKHLNRAKHHSSIYIKAWRL